jgi:hypothetical protein
MALPVLVDVAGIPFEARTRGEFFRKPTHTLVYDAHIPVSSSVYV